MIDETNPENQQSNEEEPIIETSNPFGMEIESEEEENEEELQRMDDLEKEKKEFVEVLRKDTPIKTVKKAEPLKDTGPAADKHKRLRNIKPNPMDKMNELLQQAEKYAHYLLSRHDKAVYTKDKKKGHSKKKNKDEDEEKAVIENENADPDTEDVPTRLFSQPSIIKGGTLKPFQINGLNWMITLYETGINGILADEMGLGKTIQTISLFGFLKEYKKIHGPHLIIAPKSTLGNWLKEFKKWLPCCRVLKLVATRDEREDILKNYLKPGKFDVCLTSYEGINICRSSLSKFKWKYLVIDEAHKIKNEESLLSINVRLMATNYKLLLTGTPLQNNLHELWSLLNFLLPDIFDSSDVFDNWFSQSEELGTQEQEARNLEMIQQLHKILRPFMLRRTKAEVDKTIPPKNETYVYVGLTETQIGIYRNMLLKRSAVENDSKSFYLNILMQLRKVCNHPYLFENVEEEGLPELGEHLITQSGKMIILDKLLLKLKKENHQVLIFSQMTRMLDILNDYCNFRGFEHCRIDGDTSMTDRDAFIAEFTKENSTKFVFLLSTRSGGLGINLATADTVILYDSDWNPQMDLQAMDRAHRIGQKNIVNVYRFITENTVEEQIIDRQLVKLKWDSLVIQQGRLAQKNKSFTKDQLKEMIQYGASQIFRSNEGQLTDADVDQLLERGNQRAKDHHKEVDEKFQNKGNLLDLAISNYDMYEFQNINYQQKKKEDTIAVQTAIFQELDRDFTRTRREKKTINATLDLAQLEREALMAIKLKDAQKPKIIRLPEHHFFPKRDRLLELMTKESEYKSKHRPTTSKGGPSSGGGPNNKPQEKEDNGLTIEEDNEKNELLRGGFPNWNKVDFGLFVQGCEKFGRTNLEAITAHIKTKSMEDTTKYSEAFWERINDLSEGQKYVKLIERGEKLLNQKIEADKLLAEKCQKYKNPRDELEFATNYYNKFRDKFFSSQHDKFLMYSCFTQGFNEWKKVKSALREESMFKFDHFFRSRTQQELQIRAKKLIKVLEKEREIEQEELNGGPIETPGNEKKHRWRLLEDKIHPKILAAKTKASIRSKPRPDAKKQDKQGEDAEKKDSKKKDAEGKEIKEEESAQKPKKKVTKKNESSNGDKLERTESDKSKGKIKTEEEGAQKKKETSSISRSNDNIFPDKKKKMKQSSMDSFFRSRVSEVKEDLSKIEEDFDPQNIAEDTPIKKRKAEVTVDKDLNLEIMAHSVEKKVKKNEV